MVFGVAGAPLKVIVDAREVGYHRRPLGQRHAEDANAYDRTLVDLAEIESERGGLAQ